MTEAPLATISDLRITFPGRHVAVEAVRGVSFTLGREKLGIVGESGSGKSMTGRALMRLLPGSARMTAKELRFGDTDLLTASERQMCQLRGRHMAMILQDPKYSLNPVVTVGRQITETYLRHRRNNRREARDYALRMLEAVKIRNPERVFGQYPHEVSGGMGQRIMIAMMLVAEPSMLIADEPTSALDVTVRFEIMQLLDELIAQRHLGVLFISHDLNLVRRFCDRVLIMYAGQVVEEIEADRLDEAQHPYTRGLLDSMPRIHSPRPRLPVLQRDPAWREAVAPVLT
ncbi:MAG: ABC transporter ATP-binding protein [Rhodobacteraceae bacterium]|nr:ABC transporter ATP-binding protein [Paracoccaceae bacterium]